jgi:hypothetical protein
MIFYWHDFMEDGVKDILKIETSSKYLKAIENSGHAMTLCIRNHCLRRPFIIVYYGTFHL